MEGTSAAQKDHLLIVHFFLYQKRGLEPADLDVWHGGKTALHNHAEVVQHLLKVGAGIEEPTGCFSFGSSDPIQARKRFVVDTALHLASIKGHLEIVQILLESGADLHATMNMAACRFTQLHSTVMLSSSNIFLTVTLLTSMPKPNKGQTALHCATIRSHFDMVYNLLNQDVDVL